MFSNDIGLLPDYCLISNLFWKVSVNCWFAADITEVHGTEVQVNLSKDNPSDKSREMDLIKWKLKVFLYKKDNESQTKNWTELAPRNQTPL